MIISFLTSDSFCLRQRSSDNKKDGYESNRLFYGTRNGSGSFDVYMGSNNYKNKFKKPLDKVIIVRYNIITNIIIGVMEEMSK